MSLNGKYWLDIMVGGCTRSDTVIILSIHFLLSPQVDNLTLCKGRTVLPSTVEEQHLLWYTDPLSGTPQSKMPVVSIADTCLIIYWFFQTIKGCETSYVPVEARVIDKPFFETGEALIIPCGTAGSCSRLFLKS